MKKRILAIGSLIIILALALFVGLTVRHNDKVKTVSQIKVVSNAEPTFFFHGWGSSYHAEEKMTAAIKNAGVTNTIVRVDVNRSGKARIIGKISKKAKNPLVEVNFQDNKLTRYEHHGYYAHAYDTAGARYVKNAIEVIRRKYHCPRVNIVAHSMGNLEVASYIKLNARRRNFPKLDHLVAIAGHYDGIIGENDRPNEVKINHRNGKPSIMRPEYRNLLALRKVFPHETRVLNIYGNLENGTNSDGDVSNASAQSLRYLLNGREKSYRELMIRGAGAQHSRLHDNRQVNQALINFIWW